MNQKISRRSVIATTSVTAVGAMAGLSFSTYNLETSEKLALLGGEKVHKGSWMQWPVWDSSAEKDVLEMLKSRRW